MININYSNKLNKDNDGTVGTKDVSLGEYKEYRRLFKVSGMPYLISDSFFCHYRTMKCLLTFYEGFWTSYLPKTEVEETLRKGYELYSNKESFEEYRDSFLKYQEDSQAFFEGITSKDEISREELEKFLKLISDLFIYYSKTEFFYTDEAAARMEDDPFLKESLKELDSIKNGGREYLNKIFFGASGYLSKVLSILSGQSGVPQTDLPHYSQKELLDLYEGQTVGNELIDRRKKSYLFVTNDSEKVEVKTGDDAAIIISDFEEEGEENQTSLKGITANGGYVRAKVRIVTSGYDNFDELHKIIKEMNTGEILVAETTSPELMMACKKASAILTNQGGLMSHAAIISRELGVPCIVGLGNITEIVSTGEEVEVDGDNAIVTLISRKDPNQKV